MKLIPRACSALFHLPLPLQQFLHSSPKQGRDELRYLSRTLSYRQKTCCRCPVGIEAGPEKAEMEQGMFLMSGVAVGCGRSVPRPDRGSACGLPAALLDTLTVATRSPAPVGISATPKEQLVLGGNVKPSHVLKTSA